jgi:myo-inositol-1(or 4)-monophosphatase
MKMLGDVMPKCAGVRRPGSAALDLAYVAAGFSDGFFEMGLSPWDVAAGALLVTEAGGLVGNFTGEANFLEQKECLAANPRIYGQLVNLIGKYSKFASAGDKAAVRQQPSPVAQDGSQEPDTAQDPVQEADKGADDDGFPPGVHAAPF